MLHLIIFVFCLATLVCLLVGFFGWRAVNGYVQERRTVQLRDLAAYQRRLALAVNRLLARADEIDQEHRYGGLAQPDEYSRRLAEACEQLVSLGDSLGVIQSHLKLRQVGQSRRLLLRSCRIAVTLSRELRAIAGGFSAIAGPQGRPQHEQTGPSPHKQD